MGPNKGFLPTLLKNLAAGDPPSNLFYRVSIAVRFSLFSYDFFYFCGLCFSYYSNYVLLIALFRWTQPASSWGVSNVNALLTVYKRNIEIDCQSTEIAIINQGGPAI